jgi:hypothetical protein
LRQVTFIRLTFNTFTHNTYFTYAHTSRTYGYVVIYFCIISALPGVALHWGGVNVLVLVRRGDGNDYVTRVRTHSPHCYVAIVTIESVELGMNCVTCNFRKRSKAKDFHGNKSV